MIRKVPFAGRRTRLHKGRVITHLELGDEVILTICNRVLQRRIDNYNRYDKRLHGYHAKYIGLHGGPYTAFGIPVFRCGRLHVAGYSCWWIRKDEAARLLAEIKATRRAAGSN